MPPAINHTAGDALKYLYRWDRQGRKGEPCNVLARGTMNSCLVEFADGYRMVTSRNAIRKAPASTAETVIATGVRSERVVD